MGDTIGNGIHEVVLQFCRCLSPSTWRYDDCIDAVCEVCYYVFSTERYSSDGEVVCKIEEWRVLTECKEMVGFGDKVIWGGEEIRAWGEWKGKWDAYNGM